MADIKTKLETLNKLINALQQSLDKLEHSIPEEVEFIQDSVVSRFKVLIEATWKDLSRFLSEQGFTDIPDSAQRVIHLALEMKVISQQAYDDLSKYLTLRTLTSRIYDQSHYMLAVNAAPQALVLVKKLYDHMVIKKLPLG